MCESHPHMSPDWIGWPSRNVVYLQPFLVHTSTTVCNDLLSGHTSSITILSSLESLRSCSPTMSTYSATSITLFMSPLISYFSWPLVIALSQNACRLFLYVTVLTGYTSHPFFRPSGLANCPQHLKTVGIEIKRLCIWSQGWGKDFFGLTSPCLINF